MSDTTLADVQEGWDAAARVDAMGHILTTGERWDEEAFFATGREEIGAVLDRLDDLGLRGKRRRLAVDFGCGVGRLAVALAEHYDRVIGVDISGEMRQRARTHPKVKYAERLSSARGADLVYSNLVLQHMPREYAHAYIHDFIRILHPDGLAVFEIPDGPDLAHQTPCLSMWGTPRATVEEVVSDAGGVMVDVEVIDYPCAWTLYRYAARRT